MSTNHGRQNLTMPELIARILHERQSFLQISEQSLEEEIAGKILGPTTEDTPENDDIGIIDPNEPIAFNASRSARDAFDIPPLQVFNAQKLELSKHISVAQNETSLSLDFVSLLLSATKPNIAKSTMSPHLAKNVPLGSLGSDRLGLEGRIEESKDKVGEGWKFQAVSKITGIFREAATALESQVTREQTYWSEISDVLGSGEVLYKTRDYLTGAKAIGVKYGYGDSGSNFHDKGLAILRKDVIDGLILFCPYSSLLNKALQAPNLYVRIRILTDIDGDYMLTGQLVLCRDFQAATASMKGIGAEIAKARYFLFERDLFYQLTREARQLINYNVLQVSDKIIVEINKEIIEIEQMPYEDTEDDMMNYQNVSEVSSLNNSKCMLILIYVKLMLCCYYKYNLHLKQRMPTRFAKWKQANSHPLILRPLLGNIRHELSVRHMHSILESIERRYLDDTKFFTVLDKFTNLDAVSQNPFQKSVTSSVSTFTTVVENIEVKNCIKATIDVTSTEIFVDLVIRVNIGKFSTIEDAAANLRGVNVLQLTFNDYLDAEECLDWSVLNFLQG